MADKPPKMTRVVRSLTGPWDETVPLRVMEEKLADPTFVPRLSFNASSRVPRGEADFVEELLANEGLVWFVDSNLVSTAEGPDTWAALLRGEERVVITLRVLNELIPFFRRHPKHPLLVAIKEKHPALLILDEPKADEPGRAVRDYYVDLLARRRFVAEIDTKNFELKEGRPPDAEELAELQRERHRHLGERGILLEKKPPSPHFTDEHLVYTAVEHAMRTGRETMILSGDQDVEEQFYKLVELLTRHYFSMCLGDHYTHDREALKPREIPPSVLDGFILIEPEGAEVLDLGDRGIHDFVPREFSFVAIGCICLDPHYTSRVIYGAEQEMGHVLSVKEQTKGLATDALGGRNIHVWGTPTTLPPAYQGDALVCIDRRDPLADGSMLVSRLDHLYAIWSKASHATVVPRPSSQFLHLHRRPA